MSLDQERLLVKKAQTGEHEALGALNYPEAFWLSHQCDSSGIQSCSAGSTDSAESSNFDKSLAPDYYPAPQPEVPISDSREFLKTDYSATIRRRHVEELVQRIQTIE